MTTTDPSGLFHLDDQGNIVDHNGRIAINSFDVERLEYGAAISDAATPEEVEAFKKSLAIRNARKRAEAAADVQRLSFATVQDPQDFSPVSPLGIRNVISRDMYLDHQRQLEKAQGDIARLEFNVKMLTYLLEAITDQNLDSLLAMAHDKFEEKGATQKAMILRMFFPPNKNTPAESGPARVEDQAIKPTSIYHAF